MSGGMQYRSLFDLDKKRGTARVQEYLRSGHLSILVGNSRKDLTPESARALAYELLKAADTRAAAELAELTARIGKLEASR